MPRYLGIAALVVALAFRAQAGVAQTTFSDGTFDPADWTFVEVETNEGGSVTTEPIADGVPGDALRITLVLGPAAGSALIAGVWLWKTPYDPAVSGAFASIDYAEDTRAVATFGNGHATGPALRQGDSIFIHRVGFTPEFAWTPKGESGLVPGDFSRLTGTLPAPDFSATAPPIEVGFYRANSSPASGSSQAIRTVDIDNWTLTLVPPCVLDADCTDADGCTTDTCVAGVCERAPVACDDGDACTDDACVDGFCAYTPRTCDDANECTADACVEGICQNVFETDFATVEARLTDLLDRIEASPCGDEELVKKVVRKLRKRIAGARKRIAAAEQTEREAKLLKLVGKAQALLDKADAYLAIAVQRGLVSPACASTLAGLLAEVKGCVAGLPLPTP